MTDNVNHPAHYETGKFECIEVMLETQGVEAVLNFCQCNAFKYLYRAKRKNGLEDMKKAVWYLNKYIELKEGHNYDETTVGEMAGSKQSDAKAEVEIQYATAEKAYFAQRDEALKINETVDEVFRLISEAGTVANRWKEALEKVEGIDTTRGWYISLTTKLSDLSDKENIRMYIMKDFTDGTDALRQLKAKRSETLREIEKNYTNVIANVESMKNAKTAVEYLEKLGFDLSALIEADNHPVTTALTVEVDTKFLFIGGEKK